MDSTTEIAAPAPPEEYVGGLPPPTQAHLDAKAAFEAALPRLLVESPDQWVAFHGGDFVAVAPTKQELMRHCFEAGWPRDEFIVRWIVPDCNEVEYP